MQAVTQLEEWLRDGAVKYPFPQIQAWWEELHWRFWEELKQWRQLVLHERNTQRVTNGDLQESLLLPDEHGRARFH